MQNDSPFSAKLQSLTREKVQAIACIALSNESAELVSFHHQAIDVNTGQATGGLVRVQGTARVADSELAWSSVLKIVKAPGRDAPSIYSDVGHAVYWKREVLAYQSGFLNDLPGGLEAARLFCAEEQPDGTFWLWLEDLVDDYGDCWSLAQYAYAATTLGRFNGAYLAGHPIPDYPWLTKLGSPRGILNHSTEIRDIVEVPRTWEHPLLRAAFPLPIHDRLQRLWADRNTLLDAFEALPQTLCHMDAWRGNLFLPEYAKGERRLVAIDWAFVGKSTIATDAGDLFSSSFGLFRVEPTDAPTFDKVVHENYLEGLREAGWGGDERIVRFAFATLPSVKYGCYAPWIADAADETKHVIWERLSRRPMKEFLESQATLLYYLLDLADEARSLLEYVSI